MEELAEYVAKNWLVFVGILSKLFDHVKTEKRFTENDLTNFVSMTQDDGIQRLYNFHQYQRKFLSIGSWLLQIGKITKEQKQKYF